MLESYVAPKLDMLTIAADLRRLGYQRMAAFVAAYEWLRRISSSPSSQAHQMEALYELACAIPFGHTPECSSPSSMVTAIRESRGPILRTVGRLGLRTSRPAENRISASAHEMLARDLSHSQERSSIVLAIAHLKTANALLTQAELDSRTGPDEFRIGVICALSWTLLLEGSRPSQDESSRWLDVAKHLARHEYENVDGLQQRLLGHIASRELIGAVLNRNVKEMNDTYEAAKSHYQHSDNDDLAHDHWLARSKLTYAHGLLNYPGSSSNVRRRGECLANQAIARLWHRGDPLLFTSISARLLDGTSADRELLQSVVSREARQRRSRAARDRACHHLYRVCNAERTRLFDFRRLASSSSMEFLREPRATQLERGFYVSLLDCAPSISAHYGPSARSLLKLLFSYLSRT